MTKKDIAAFELFINRYLEFGTAAISKETIGLDRNGAPISTAVSVLRGRGLVIPFCGRPSRKKFDKGRAARMLDAGWSQGRIARKFGMTEMGISVALSRAGLTSKKTVNKTPVPVDSATATA